MTDHLNLLTPTFRRHMLLRSCWRLWSRITLGAGGLSLILAVSPWIESLRLQALRDQGGMQAARLARMQEETLRMNARLVADQSLREAIAACEDDGLALRMMAVFGQVVRQMEVEVRLRDIELTRTAAPTASQGDSVPAGKPPPGETISVSMLGLTADQLTITQFMTRLRDTGIFETIEARPLGSRGVEGELTHAFRVDGRLLRPRNAAKKS